MIFPGWGDGGSTLYEGLATLNPMAALDWLAQPFFISHSDVEFVRFYKDGTVQFGPSRDQTPLFQGEPELSGYIIQAHD